MITVSYESIRLVGANAAQAAEWIGRKLWACYGAGEGNRE